MLQRTDSYWIGTSGQPHYPREKHKLFVDCVIVGGGITGLTAAFLLKEAGKTVAVLEQGQIAMADTGHTTAHLTEMLDTRYHTLISDFGRGGAQLAQQSSRAAIETISQIVDKFQIECSFERIPGYFYSESMLGTLQIRREMHAARELGISAEWVKEIPLPFKTSGGIKVPNQAKFHPRKYLLALAERIHGNGSYIFENTPAIELKDGEPCQVTSPHGEIQAHHLIVATHTPVSNKFILMTKIAAYRTYACGIRLKTRIPEKALYWDTADPYHYTRNQANIWIIGGADHKTGENNQPQKSQEDLEEYIRTHFDIESIHSFWSGQIFDSVDGLPYIGKNPLSKNTYIATGFSGNGMTFGTVSGMLISDLILKKANPWQSLFSPNRIKPIASATTFLSENIDYPLCMIKDRLKSPEIANLSALGNGQASTMKIGGKTAGVYRDSRGNVHAVSITCPHMGCHVHWNGIEKSWDCPCHGSRFNYDGQVLTGPATSSLQKIELESKDLKDEKDRAA